MVSNMVAIGLPRMHKETSEVRDFLPDFVRHLSAYGRVYVEDGYGGGMGLSIRDYGDVSIVSLEDALSQQYILVLRSPKMEELDYLQQGSVLLSMLHPETHPRRMAKLKDRGVIGISLDRITDDNGNRLVENLRGCSWYATEIAFKELMNSYGDFWSSGRPPIKVTVMGPGHVGLHAVEAATKYGDVELNERIMEGDLAGVEVTVIGRNVTRNRSEVTELLKKTDVFVDCTKRDNPSKHIIPNGLLSHLPEHAVILDITADQYDTLSIPPIVKAIEGIPTGDLDQFIFYPDDPAYESIPSKVDTTHRRIVTSCYSWPGIKPKECMELYGNQLEPIMTLLLQRGLDEINIRSNSTGRAIIRGLC